MRRTKYIKTWLIMKGLIWTSAKLFGRIAILKFQLCASLLARLHPLWFTTASDNERKTQWVLRAGWTSGQIDNTHLNVVLLKYIVNRCWSNISLGKYIFALFWFSFLMRSWNFQRKISFCPSYSFLKQKQCKRNACLNVNKGNILLMERLSHSF